jgi:ribosome-binding ATPase YchF (GTP1/OBG family)
VYPVHDAHKFTDSEGRVLPEARLVPKGTKLKEFAASIHTELAKGFLYAVDARTGRRLGADAEVEDGMVVKIVSAR